jgi:hypothetical protein
MIITLTASLTFKNKFFTSLDMGGYVRISNFNVMSKNKYEIRWCWGYVLKIGAITLIEHIEHILISLKFVVTNNICDYTIHDSMKRYHIEELSWIGMVVIALHEITIFWLEKSMKKTPLLIFCPISNLTKVSFWTSWFWHNFFDWCLFYKGLWETSWSVKMIDLNTSVLIRPSLFTVQFKIHVIIMLPWIMLPSRWDRVLCYQ